MTSWISLLDIVYPVGSFYMSTSSVSPASIVGGTWTQLTNTFLYCSSSSLQKGGTSTHYHTLSKVGYAEIDFITSGEWLNIGHNYVSGLNLNPKVKRAYKVTQVNDSTNTAWNGIALGGRTDYYDYDNIEPLLPPYTTVYCWYRTA